MKTLPQLVSLEGQAEEITLSELRSKPGEVFAQVSMGKDFTVTKGGTPVAEITKHKPFDLPALAMLRKLSK